MMLFGCLSCRQKDALIAAQLKTIDSLLSVVKDAEVGRRGVEAALAAIADQRAAQAAERAMGVSPRPAAQPARPMHHPRTPLTPWTQQHFGGGHLDLERERRLAVEMEEPEDVGSPPRGDGQ